MANSYQLHTANGSTTQFSFANIDGWINSGFLKVYVNGVLKTTGYNLIDLNTVNPKVEFLAGHIPTNGQTVVIQRETPATVSTFKANVVDFSDSSILTAADLDKSVEGILHITQEAEDTGSGAIGKTVDETNWDAEGLRLTNLANATGAQDAVTLSQFQTATLFGSGVVVPQSWSLTGANTATYTLSTTPLNTDSTMFVVEVGGVIQAPTTYIITAATSTGNIVFDSTVATGVPITVRNFGVSRNIPNQYVTTAMIQDLNVTTGKINDLAVTTAKINDLGVTTGKIANDAVTYAKIQNVSATDRILGRSTAGAGDVEEIPCTSFGRALLDDTSVAAQRSTLGLGNLATASTIADAQVDPAANIAFSKLQTVAANSLLGNNTGSAGAASSLGVAAVKTLLNYGSMSGETKTDYLARNINQVGAVNLIYGTSTLSTDVEIEGSASVTNAAPLNPDANLSAITFQTLAGAFEINSSNLRPTVGTGGTWSVVAVLGDSRFTAIAIRTA